MGLLDLFMHKMGSENQFWIWYLLFDFDFFDVFC